MPKKRTKKQNKQIWSLLHKTGAKEYKKDLCMSVSQGRTTHTSDLYYHEARALIQHLKDLNGQRMSRAERSDRMRKKILHMAHEIGWEHPDGKVDIGRVNNWAKKYGYLHKPLNDYTYNELPQLVSQFERYYVQCLKKAR